MLVCALDGLLILRQERDPVLWVASQQGTLHPGGAFTRQVIAADPYLQGASHVQNSSHSTSSDSSSSTSSSNSSKFPPLRALVGTKSGTIYRLQNVDNVMAVQKIHSLQESVASLILIPHDHITQTESLLVIGTLGGICWIDLQATDDDDDDDDDDNMSPPITRTKRSVEERVQSAFMVGGYVYILTTEDGRVLRTPASSLVSDRACNHWECLDLPHLRVFVPILQGTESQGFYGVNSDGRILRFSADLSSINGALTELEKLSEQAKRLESECQMENQRIMTFNRLVQELQQYTLLSQAEQQDSLDRYTIPPVNATFTTFVQPVAEGYNGRRRYYMHLTIQSALNISWDKGWSAVITMRTHRSCPHGVVVSSEPERHYEIFASLTGLSPQTTWTRDIDIDLQSLLDLPLTITLGLQLNEDDDKRDNHHHNNNDNSSAYFYVESFDLDAIHFAEPVQEDRFKFHLAYYPTCAMTGHSIINNDNNTSSSDHRSQEQGGDIECKECASATEQAQQPIAFDIDTQEIQVAQCLPALLGDAIPNDRMMTLVQSSFRASLYIPDECLLKTMTTTTISSRSSKATQSSPSALTQTDGGVVWVTMETRIKDTTESTNSSERVVQAWLNVKGPDPRRTMVVYKALRGRVADLF
ncbi:hypothetical protein BGZ65_012894 [Modicella reniformis]|uniref:Uncharacterized protein n=1 Tax=Modicella reniformis TaxID=1440133 RepID=A0A9P6SNF1_9FUNG|nr:hypothetical protein BGZ65_012894 [Modicella reniformis]